ncbi:MAG: lytic transglycosylase domain-containing protein [Acidobacteriota bacterium]
MKIHNFLVVATLGACTLLVNVWSKPLSSTSPVAVVEARDGLRPLENEVRRLLNEALRYNGQQWSQTNFDEASAAIVRVVVTYQYSPMLVMSLIQMESSFRLDALSSQGAVGLTQILPSTADAVAKALHKTPPTDEELKNPSLNIELGFAYLAQLQERLGSQEAALAAYNAGPAFVEHRVGLPLPMAEYRREISRGEATVFHWMK